MQEIDDYKEERRCFPNSRMPDSFGIQVSWNIVLSVKREYFKTVTEYKKAIDYFSSTEYLQNPVYKR